METVEDFVNNHLYKRNNEYFNYSANVKSNHRTFLNKFFKDNDVEIVKDIVKTKEIINSFTSSKNLHKRYFGCLASFCNYQYTKTNDISWNLNNAYNSLFKETQDHIISEEKPVLKNTDYNSKIGDLPEKCISEIMNKIILLYHFSDAPLRSDLCSIKIRNYDTSVDNYYNNETKQFVFNKIVKTKRKITQNINEILNALIIKRMIFQDGEYLITQSNNKPFSNKVYSNKFSRLSKKVFGESIGINTCRKLAISKQLKDTNGGNDGLKVIVASNLAKQMGNSVNTVLSYYSSKFQNDESESSSNSLHELEQKHKFLIKQINFNEILNSLSITVVINDIIFNGIINNTEYKS